MASLSSISISRPVLATVLSITIVIFGIIGFTSLGVREYPSVDKPIVTVSTSYVGANADVIESQITEPLEESVNGIAGISTLTSTSRDGRSTLVVEFDLSIDLEAAANDVRDKVSAARRNLPPDVDPPIVSKSDADAGPIVFLNVKSDSRSLLELSDMADKTFKERLQTIPGVSEVRIWGEQMYSMRLWLDPDKMAAYGLTPVDVQQALAMQNIELPSGRIEGKNTELSVRTMGRLRTPEEFNEMILIQRGDKSVRFKDIGEAKLGPENERTVLKRDGIPMVGVVLVPQPGSNSIDIADEFYKRVEKIKTELPADVELGIGFDTTEYIRASITEVKETIFTAFFLVVLIIFLFLRDWRTTIIPVITIPISLIGTFFIMYVAGFTINVLTLLGIVLAIGLVVDDTIVMLENIYTKIEEGMEPYEAGRKGAAEIFFAVISTTVALAAVFLPVIFLEGLTGRLFREFGIVVAGAVIISSFVALTLTPMLSTRLLKKRDKEPWFYRKTEPFFKKMNKVYANSLHSFLGMRWMAWAAMAISAGLIWLTLAVLPQEMAPLEDRDGFRIYASGPEGATFDYMDRYLDQVIGLINKEVPESKAIISVTSPGFGASSSVNSGFVRAMLVDAGDRDRSQQEIVDSFGAKIGQLPGARAFLSQEQTIGNRRGGLPVQFVIQAQNQEKLKEVLPAFMEAANASSVFSFVDLNLKFNKPELRIDIDRDKARVLGVSVEDISQTLQLGLSGQRFGYFIMNGKQYQVIGQVTRASRDEPLDLRSLYVKNERGKLIQLDNVVKLSEQSTPPQLFRFNRFSSATVSAGLAGKATLQEGIAEVRRIAEETLDDSFSTSLDGNSREYEESSSSLLFAFLLALTLIYLVLAAQFESFSGPLIIMFTVPLALAGALVSLWYFGQSLNIFSQIGIIMLVGLVTKNGILIVEFANQRREEGLDKYDAIAGASIARFRPILMTSLSTILGILPLALGLGAGSESRVSMGVAVIGGLVFATFLTLYIIPAIYMYLARQKRVIVEA